MDKLISQSCGELQLVVCLSRGDGPFEDRSSTRGCLTSLRNKPQQSKNSLGNFQHQYLAELLVNMHSYHLMVKSVSCFCVHGRWLFSNPVTNVILRRICRSINLIIEPCGQHLSKDNQQCENYLIKLAELFFNPSYH